MALLPGMVIVVIPGLLLAAFRGTRWEHALREAADPLVWAAVMIGGLGAALGAWTAGLFARHGGGTAAPWDPPRRFVVRGPYRHVRNPMITGVCAVLLAESLALRSWPIAAWLALFAAANMLYIPLVEEPALVRRFGEAYLDYRRNVPRWLPRARGWPGPQSSPNH
jgi:protein-S-isoprenylcysteine O-methyltransferase Ste14